MVVAAGVVEVRRGSSHIRVNSSDMKLTRPPVAGQSRGLATPGSVRKAPPMVGEDNDRFYGGLLGFTPRRSLRCERQGRSERAGGAKIAT